MAAHGNLEPTIYKVLRENGFTVHDKGWPDCLAISPAGEAFFIEVKDNGDRIWDHQGEMLHALSEIGLNVFVVGRLKKLPKAFTSISPGSKRAIKAHIRNKANLDKELREIERNAILEALTEAKWNIGKAALSLGISFEALRYRMNKLNLNYQYRVSTRKPGMDFPI